MTSSSPPTHFAQGDLVRCGRGPVYRIADIGEHDGYATLVADDGTVAGSFLDPVDGWASAPELLAG